MMDGIVVVGRHSAKLDEFERGALKPMRSWRKKTGPREPSLMTAAMTANAGARTMRATAEVTRSKIRLTTRPASTRRNSMVARGSRRTRITGDPKSRSSSLVESSGLTSWPVTYTSEPLAWTAPMRSKMALWPREGRP